jgi:hypothetical protein
MVRALSIFTLLALAFVSGCGGSDDETSALRRVSVDSTIRAFSEHGVPLRRAARCELPEGFVEGSDAGCFDFLVTPEGKGVDALARLEVTGSESIQVLVLERALPDQGSSDSGKPTETFMTSHRNIVVLCSHSDCDGQRKNLEASLSDLS